MIVKPHLRWSMSFMPPSEFKDFRDWALFSKTADGFTVLRVFGVTVRVFK